MDISMDLSMDIHIHGKPANFRYPEGECLAFALSLGVIPCQYRHK